MDLEDTQPPKRKFLFMEMLPQWYSNYNQTHLAKNSYTPQFVHFATLLKKPLYISLETVMKSKKSG